MDAMDANQDKRIHAHCEANFRASAFIAMSRILRLGWKEADAFDVMHTVWDEDAYPVWKMFIEDAMKRRWIIIFQPPLPNLWGLIFRLQHAILCRRIRKSYPRRLDGHNSET